MTTRRGFFATLGAAVVAASVARVLPVEQAPPIQLEHVYWSQEFTYNIAEFTERYSNPMAKRLANLMDQQLMRDYHRHRFNLTTSL